MSALSREAMSESSAKCIHKALNREPWNEYFCSKVSSPKTLGKQELNVLPINWKEDTYEERIIIPIQRKHSKNKKYEFIKSMMILLPLLEAMLLSFLLLVLMSGVINIWMSTYR